MGRTQCFRANAAYSLYGVKTGQTDSGSSGCLEKNYINSFFTNMGVESFTDSFGIDAEGYGASSECKSEENGDERKLESDDYTYTHGESLFGDYTSYGTGCSKDGEFVLATFEGAYCSGGHYVATTDDLGYLNNDLDALGCKTIYSGYGGQQGDRKLDDNENIAANLLSYSTVCNMLEYPTKCPDPYGLKTGQESSLKKAADAQFKKVPSFMPIMSTIFCAGALFFLYLTEKTKYSTKTKSIDPSGPEPMPEPPLILRTVETFSRTATALSMRTQSIREKLIDYAEAENDEDDQIDETYCDKSYQSAPEEAAPMQAVRSLESVKSVHSTKSGAPSVHSATASVHSATASVHSATASIHSGAPSVHSAAQPAVEGQPTTEVEPTTPAQQEAPKEDESNAELANTMLAEKGFAAAKPKKSETKNFKRPRLAKITKTLFRKRNRKTTPPTI
jgi:hypothetical protein